MPPAVAEVVQVARAGAGLVGVRHRRHRLCQLRAVVGAGPVPNLQHRTDILDQTTNF